MNPGSPFPQTHLYFEAHVTVEPGKEAGLMEICKPVAFRVAELYMKNNVRHDKDSFCTGRGKDYIDLYDRMMHVVQECLKAGITVWRYKIENTLLDVRIK